MNSIGALAFFSIQHQLETNEAAPVWAFDKKISENTLFKMAKISKNLYEMYFRVEVRVVWKVTFRLQLE